MLSKDLTQESEIIGFSGQGKPLIVMHIGRKDSSLRVFIIAGQHGDESGSREAAGRLFASLESPVDDRAPLFQISILADANPDGSSIGSRENASGFDLNRDHLHLKSRETQAIHSYVRQWRPHIVIDAHNYPPRRKRLLAEERIIDTDVFLDTPTLPEAVLSRPIEGLGNELVENVKSDLAALGFSCERYLLFKPYGKVRTSSLGLLDARNSLSLKYGALGVIVEGRAPTKGDDAAGRDRLVAAQYHALRSILDWSWRNRDALTLDAPRRPPSLIPIRWRYMKSDKLFEVPFQNSRTGDRYTVAFTSCHSDIKSTLQVPLPYGYAIPLNRLSIIEILRRHGIVGKRIDSSLIPKLQLSPMHNPVPRWSEKEAQAGLEAAKSDRVKLDLLSDYAFYPTNTGDGVFLALLLEADSKYGLWDHWISDPNSETGQQFPILKLVL